MQPYYVTHHIAGLPILVIAMAWGMMELSQRSQARREGATRIGGSTWRVVVLCCIAVSTALEYLTPRVVPAAAIRPGVAAYAIGLALLLAGIVLRGWSFLTLGEYFTHTVMVSADQRVIDNGPYRMLRHPSYTGILLAAVGIGLACANWVTVAALLVLALVPLLWRIRVEERALLTTVGEPYRAYAAGHKRLVPLIW